jgi:hypothetical protein
LASDEKNNKKIKSIKKKEIESALVEYINFLKISMDSYSNIIKKLAEFQENHSDVYGIFTDLIENPDEMNDLIMKLKSVKKEIFFQFLDVMFTFQVLDSKIRKMYFLSPNEKQELANDIQDYVTEIENLYNKLKTEE